MVYVHFFLVYSFEINYTTSLIRNVILSFMFFFFKTIESVTFFSVFSVFEKNTRLKYFSVLMEKNRVCLVFYFLFKKEKQRGSILSFESISFFLIKLYVCKRSPVSSFHFSIYYCFVRFIAFIKKNKKKLI